MRDTPLRLLIKMFPELAKKVFDQCTETNLQQYADRDEGNGNSAEQNKLRRNANNLINSTDDERFKMTFNYELLDDTYTIFTKSNDSLDNTFMMNLENLINGNKGQGADWSNMKLYDDNSRLVPEAEPYTPSSTLRK